MPSGSTIALFRLAAVALAVVPGPAVAYIVTQSVDKGRRAGGRARRGARAARLRRFASGAIFVALGVTTAAAHRS